MLKTVLKDAEMQNTSQFLGPGVLARNCLHRCADHYEG